MSWIFCRFEIHRYRLKYSPVLSYGGLKHIRITEVQFGKWFAWKIHNASVFPATLEQNENHIIILSARTNFQINISICTFAQPALIMSQWYVICWKSSDCHLKRSEKAWLLKIDFTSMDMEDEKGKILPTKKSSMHGLSCLLATHKGKATIANSHSRAKNADCMSKLLIREFWPSEYFRHRWGAWNILLLSDVGFTWEIISYIMSPFFFVVEFARHFVAFTFSAPKFEYASAVLNWYWLVFCASAQREPNFVKQWKQEYKHTVYLRLMPKILLRPRHARSSSWRRSHRRWGTQRPKESRWPQ